MSKPARIAIVIALIALAFQACADEIRFRKITLADQFFSEGANAGDFNHDGKMDVVAGPFWYEGPDFKTKHLYWPGSKDPIDPHGYSQNFFAFTDDLNGDGWDDILIVGFPGEAGHWYQNPAGKGEADTPWQQHQIIDHVDNESPAYLDLNGDGARDLVCINRGRFGWAGADRSAPDKPWTFHPITPANPAYQKFTHGLGVGDINGDGKSDLIEKDGWWEQPASLAGDPEWPRHEFPFAEAGAQMHAMDANGDGKPDIVTSLSAHGYGLAWYEQTANPGAGQFTKHLIMGAKSEENAQSVVFSQPHALAVADIDGDGLNDLVTGKRYWAHGPDKDPEPNAPAVLYWFGAKKNAAAPGGVEFVAHKIDDDSGVGTQVVVADMNGDKKPDIVIGNKKGAFVFIQEAGKAAVDPFTENIRSTEARKPEDERTGLHVPPGFEVQLVASEPDIAKPLNMAFDARGRLWITETVEYPYPAKDRKGRDRIKIIDIGPDGKATKISTFAEELNIPIGLYPYKDGCIAFGVPEIRRYFDDNGDGRADRSETLYGSFGDNDTHGITNGFRRGFDGWLYACHGFNNLSKITASDGSSITLISGNTYRMRVDGTHVEQFTWGQTNPYGMCMDALGNVFTSDSHSKPIYELIRGGYYEGINKTDDGLGFAPAMMKHTHGSSAIAGVAKYEADQFPSEFRGNMFVGNVMTSRVNHDSISSAGSTPIAKEETDLVRSDDPWFRPVDLQLGPDGAIYVADFYNRIIGHYEVALDHPKRDHERGRIWRIVYRGDKNAAPRVPPDLSKADVSALIAALGDANLTVRRLATDELTDRIGPSCAAAIRAMLAGDAKPVQKIHGLWILFRLGALDPAILDNASNDPDASVRVHAMRIAAEITDWKHDEPIMINVALADSDPLVQRCAADALGRHPSSGNLRPLLALLASAPESDTHLRYAARVALREQFHKSQGNLFAQIDSLGLTPDQTAAILDIAPAVPTAESAEFIVAHLDLATRDPADAQKFLRHAIKHAADAATTDAAVAGVRKLLADDLEMQLELFDVVQSATEQRGQSIGPSVKDWGSQIARQAIQPTGDALAGWQNIAASEGSTAAPIAWTVQSRPSADGDKNSPFFSTLPRGEAVTGTLRSPTFTCPAALSFYIAGHNGWPKTNPAPANFVRLIDAADHHVLLEAPAPRNDLAQKINWDLKSHAGKSVYLDGIDGNKDTAFAWIAFGRFTPAVVAMPKGALDDDSLAQAAQIAESLKVTDLSDDLSRMSADAGLSMSTRAAAAMALASFGQNDALKLLGTILADPSQPSALREKIARGLGRIDSNAARQTQIAAMKLASNKLQSVLAASLVATKEGAQAMLAAIAKDQAPRRLLQERPIADALLALGDPAMQSRINDLTQSLPPMKEELQKSVDQHRAAYAKAGAKASPERGTKTFATSCAACHQFNGQGRQVGPQLDGIAARGADRVIEDILDPSRNVDPAFHYTTVVLKDNTAVTGLFRREEPAGVQIFVDALGKEIPVPTDKIKRRINSTASLMPDNLGAALSADDFNDLVAYLMTQRDTPTK